MDWRVDVTISTSEMARVLKPSILMRMVDSTGTIRTFEVNPEVFHKMRYSVARVLKVPSTTVILSDLLLTDCHF